MRLNQVTVPSTDLDRSIAFYRALGLELIVNDGTARYARFVCPDGGSTFSLHVVDHAIVPSDVVVYFECDDLDARVAALVAAGYVVSGPRDEPWLWREARLVDPDGLPICLFFAGTNRIDPPWRLPRAGAQSDSR